ncbi:DUF5683 domain-containing protein [Lutimonas zeaxanthinifaciens]|uniref:DUF5683 domain-containing protein n=1 Tax=Lutimonas zeaxanthinifaciens TaxID=3060215 RepID=UPI00265CC628|nr:DUF5683 domain-containing protein [Lutimonas sp. YSD2104]WKK67305.1 DUF5683 domain-containing protein [Lutimonas sp. YSD2104]
MLQKIIFSLIICIFCWNIGFSQEEEKEKKKKKEKEKTEEGVLTLESQTIDPLSPARAAFYSAVLPGLGQAYNKKYWKIPIVYAALGTGVYFVVDNQQKYDRYRDAYKLRISGRPDEFDGTGDNPNISDDGLIRAQDIYKKNRDLALFITLGLYALNIIEANVDAHLDDRAFNRNLSWKPSLYVDPASNQAVAGLNFKFDF